MDLILVNPPFAAPNYPSIQLGIIHALATRHDLTVKTINANLAFYKESPAGLYDLIAEHRGVRFGDWLFSRAAFGAFAPTDFVEAFTEDISKLCQTWGRSPHELLAIREELVPHFISEVTSEILQNDPCVVGFTSTFEQNVAALAIARELKQRASNVKTVFGGANFDGRMGLELFKRFEWIDFAVIGDVEPVFDDLCRLSGLIDGSQMENASILDRRHLRATAPARSTFQGSLDLVPTPHYADYFQTLKTLAIDTARFSQRVTIPIETSRGCWWGEKHHCKFCGLNGSSMHFRKKSSPAALDMIRELGERHNVVHFSAVDNIADRGLLDFLAGQIDDFGIDAEFFFEVKANLSRSELEAMAAGGIKYIQPGIESLSTRVLRLMDKGIRAIQNVNTLKWCRYYGINVSWNLLYGFPGEASGDYELQRRLIEQIGHLQPPVGGGRLWLERFSPYFNKSDGGFANVVPERSLQHIYPQGVEIGEIAYFFDYSPVDTISDDEFLSLSQDLDAWRSAWKTAPRPYLYYAREFGSALVIDGRRTPHRPKLVRYKKPIDEVLSFCGERPRSLEMIQRHLHGEVGSIDDASLVSVLDRIVSRGFFIEEDGSYLNLALPIKKSSRTKLVAPAHA